MSTTNNKMLNLLEYPSSTQLDVYPGTSLGDKATKGILAVTLASAPARFISYSSGLHLGDEVAKYIPDIINPIYHSGNSGVTAVLLGIFLNQYRKKEQGIMTAEGFIKNNKTAAIIAGLGGISLNAIGEVVGYGPRSTADKYDFLWGMLGAYAAFQMTIPGVEIVDKSTESTTTAIGSRVIYDTKHNTKPKPSRNNPKKYSHHHRYSKRKK